ncbi:MAG: class I SAM-dependent methyltransferase [Sciscionella sp.]|nr:class I SAM-dependent methyltransferase [Sciscionella sp.]
MGLSDVSRHWNRLGNDDPMWAVLTEGGKRGNRWDADEFLATGAREIRAVLDRVAKLGAEPKFGTALDFGCGAGRLVQGMATAGFEHATGVDISKGMLDKAAELNRHGDRVRFVHNESADLSIVDSDSVDFVYSCRVLQHMPTELAHGYIREFFRIARAGGTVVFQIPSHPAANLQGALLRVVPTPVLNRLRKGMEMHGTPQRDIRALVAAANGEVLAADTDTSAGNRWVSYLYIARKRG